MPLGSGNIIQTASGNTGTGTPTAIAPVLGSATTGHTVIIGLSCDVAVTSPPAGFTQDAHFVQDLHHHYVFRKQLSTSETTWSIPMSNTAIGAWWVEEVSGLDAAAPFVTGISNGTSSAVATISTGTTTAAAVSDLLCYASFSSYNLSSFTITWSAETNSFTEIQDTASGAWGGTTRVSIAECRKFPGASGSFECTATLSHTADAATTGILVVYQGATTTAAVIDDVTVGSSFGLTAQVTLRDGAGTHLNLYTKDSTVQGAIVISSLLAVTGTMNYATSVIPILTSSQTFTIGDVVQSNTTGECMVVRDTWIDVSGPEWSNTTARSTKYSTVGWTQIGSATIN